MLHFRSVRPHVLDMASLVARLLGWKQSPIIAQYGARTAQRSHELIRSAFGEGRPRFHRLGAGIAAEIALALSMESNPPRPSVTGWRDRLPPYCHPALRDAIRAIHRSLDKQLEIDDICASAKDVSERTLQRLFRRHLGTTVGAYHRASRLEHARELLRLTSLSVMEVALTAGFESATHFSQCYGKHFGCTPRRDR
jgi:transcriptional regulator GlxA family with amidase domain